MKSSRRDQPEGRMMAMVSDGTSVVTERAINSETHAAELVADFAWDGRKLEPGIGITLSGGGFRAMLFHAGALTRLNELALLSKANRISSVSGGSIAAGYVAAVWSRLQPDAAGVFREFSKIFVAPLLAFSQQNLDIKYTLEGLLPGISAAARVAASPAGDRIAKITRQIGRANVGISRKVSVIRKGFSEVSIDEVMETAGLTKHPRTNR
jgi:Patatin-like phospholipase